MEEACSSIPELVVPMELPTAEKIHQMAAVVRKTQEAAAKVQLEMNLQIIELHLKAHPSKPLEVREKCTRAIQLGLEQISQAT